ncbi:MAG TPA: hypothetical protein VNM66_08080 [Thermodesulfobacteriota bacterium]|nr:hypothetical protein [Thermodesulfobacteriota bacterium]
MTRPAGPAAARPSAATAQPAQAAGGRILARIQRHLERIYDLALPVQVEDYLLDGEALAALRLSGDGLVVVQEGDTLDVGIYVEPPSLANLVARNPFTRLDRGNLADFCTVTEEVSHFLYLVWNALHARRVTRLELELQAEVDKFVTVALCLAAQRGGRVPEGLAARLFERYRLKEGLDAESRERYETANALARRYCRWLARRYLERRQLGAMVAELRRFYRLPQAGKFEAIGRLA